MKRILTALILLTGLAAQENAPKITYIANDGFLLERGGKKALIDGVAEADLLLVTHPGALDLKQVAAYLRGDARRTLVARKQTVDLMRKEEGFAQFRNQIREVNLQPGARQGITVKGITVDILALAQSIAFVIDLGGVRFLHPGDANVESLNAFAETPAGVLFVNYLDRSQAAREFIGRKIKPSRIIAMRTPPAELEEELKKIRAAYPYAIVFRKNLEERSLPIEIDLHDVKGDYLGQPDPGATPRVFARGTVSSDDLEHGPPSFSPDHSEVFWWVNRHPGPENKEWLSFVMTMRRDNGRWSAPYASPFDTVPLFSADGRRMYFESSQPCQGAAKDSRQSDIWFVERKGSGWSDPQCLGLTVRYPELRGAFFPSIARGGAVLYFMSRTPGLGLELDIGIYRTELVNGEYSKPELLPRSVNLPASLNWTPFVAPDESFLLFSSNRAGSLDPGRHPAGNPGGDIYISRRRPDGGWTEAVSLGEPVNSKQQERFPGLSPDGKRLFFTRYTPGHDDDVYWITTASVPELRKTGIRK